MKEEVENWYKKGRDDLEKAIILFNNKKYDGTAFYCQQAAEKALKSLLLSRLGEIRKIHDLVELGKEAGLPAEMLEDVKELTMAYIYSRYPDVKVEKDIKEISSVFLESSRRILEWIKKKL